MSAQEQIIHTNDFNVETDISFKKPTLNKSGGKSVGVTNSTTSKSLYLSTPLMLTWGVQDNQKFNAGEALKYDMALQFPSEDYVTPQTKKFLDAMIAMENKIKTEALKNSKEWFNKKLTSEVIDAFWTPMLRYPKTKLPDGTYGEPDMTRAPTMRIKLDYWENEFKCEIYDMDQKLLFPVENVAPIDLIPKATNVAVVLRCGGVWFAGGKFGCTWKLEQAVVKPRASLKGKCHIKLDSSARETLMAQKDEDEEEEVTGIVIADDSDEEVPSFSTAPAPTPAPAPAPVPPTAPKKKVVRRKKVTAETS